ncbi:hypothetical protein STEG23_020591, partial [Scotinomys teguina]
DQDCSLKNRELDGPAPWFLDPGGWSKTAVVRLFFIFPGICTLSLGIELVCYNSSTYLGTDWKDSVKKVLYTVCY